MIDFQKVTKIILPTRFVDNIYDHVRSCGEEGVEGVGLWLGQQEKDVFTITCSIIPAQKSYRLEDGLLYNVDSVELHRINVWAYQQRLALFSQIHSHPSRAYHSDTDDAYAIITALGGFSIVIPNFGFDPINKKYWAVYRLKPDGWNEVTATEVNKLFEIV